MAYALVDDISVYYEVHRGRASAPGQPLTLFLHGAGGSSQHWTRLLAHLADCVCALLVDLPGLGRSGGRVPGTVDSAAGFIKRLLSQLGVTPPIICVGHSLGGLVAQRLALSEPAWVAGLVLIATAPRVRTHPDFVRAAISGDFDIEALRASFGRGTPRHLQDLVLGELPRTRLPEGATGFMDDLDLREEVSALSVPTLIVTGDDDVIISPRHSRWLHQEIAGSTLLIIPGGGHYVQVEQPERVALALNQFLCGS